MPDRPDQRKCDEAARSSPQLREDDEYEDRIYRKACQEIPELIDRMAHQRASHLAARMIRSQDLVPRPREGEPTATELMHAVLGRLRASGPRVGTLAGAHNIALRAFRDAGVAGASEYPVWRRTREEVDQNPNPAQPREGAGRSRPIDEKRRGATSQRTYADEVEAQRAKLAQEDGGDSRSVNLR